ncbi:ATP-dependent helicase/nuclease subunit A [Gossypium arboreum]|uniref:ATP-dependent helicase/nuclease subunit A n=1 Tax=Gossypium arboreum TaxID=29729 RepID=A0A0B0NJD1_GOSAR|nr:ATP-dependent helicase/nuclease subunit A [Gossypium arboreum]
MSVERSFEAWEEVQRHGQDLADRLAQGFTCLIQSHMIPPSFPWPNPPKSKLFDLEFPSQSFGNKDFGLPIDNSAIFDIGDIGNRIGQVGADFGAGLNGLVQQFFRRLPIPLRAEESAVVSVRGDMSVKGQKAEVGVNDMEGLVGFLDSKDFGFVGNESHSEGVGDEEIPGFNLKSAGLLGRPQGIINITSTFESRTRDLESSLVARGDLWRVEASNANSTSRNDNSLFLIQLGPVLFVRDTTLLLPVHLSKQHLLWYGYDRKNGMHSLCPAVWSKHRRWLLMSMLCLNPLACSFVDLQFPNGQLTYVSGEGLTTSAFLPLCGGLLQAQGQYPGEMRYSFSCKVSLELLLPANMTGIRSCSYLVFLKQLWRKDSPFYFGVPSVRVLKLFVRIFHQNKWGTRITPMVLWPDNSFALGLSQALAWKRSGLMMKPSIQFSLCPTFGGSNPGLRAEVIHTVKDNLNLICGCSLVAHPAAFASISLGRSKWNGNVGNSGIVVRVDTPLSSVGRPSFSLQINNVIEF